MDRTTQVPLSRNDIMFITSPELTTARAALAENERWCRANGFSVLGDRARDTLAVLDLEAGFDSGITELSGHDGNVVYISLRRIGGPANEYLARLLMQRT